MIKTDRGNTKIEGTIVDLLAEYACITKRLYEAFKEEGASDEEAKSDLKTAFDAVFLSHEEMEAIVKERLMEMVENLFSRKEE